jgi:DNA-binding NtrC family response regulator
MSSAMTSSKPVVLIVEDEPIIRMNAADFLTDFGIDSVEAANADEALSILGSRPDIDVVFTDVNMPGSMDGLELSRLVSQRWPALGIIITSGMVRLARSALAANTLFFEKPYDLDKVVSSIRKLAA